MLGKNIKYIVWVNGSDDKIIASSVSDSCVRAIISELLCRLLKRFLLVASTTLSCLEKKKCMFRVLAQLTLQMITW